MSKSNDMKMGSDIDFYRNGTVYKVLKRFEFSDDEKKLINAAILTSKKPNPNVKLIEKADALLKMVASSREPLIEPEDEAEVKRRQAQIKMAEYPLPETNPWKKPVDNFTFFIVVVAMWVLIAIVINYYFGSI